MSKDKVKKQKDAPNVPSSSSYEDAQRRFAEERSKDARSTEELIWLALQPNEDVSGNALSVLWYRPSEEMLAIARRLSISHDPRERSLAAQILGQGGIPERLSLDTTLPILLSMLERETDPQALSVICVALGDVNSKIGDLRAIEPLLHLKNHPHEEVRYGVVQGLLFQHSKPAVEALIELSDDRDRDIRDWATFGLAQMKEFDTPIVRTALWARVSDEDDDTRGEALVGLALRGDIKVIEPLIKELESAGDSAGQTLFEAAIAAGNTMNDLQICTALQRLQTLPEHFGYSDELVEALNQCSQRNE